ncbi:hypothetical protein N7G274_001782 [Stereocaulon virgatum]|uniref:Uncharacterized protein n=1 Tax=Stereocaulon virgatum TaxID=373712 RepID=A0ABR4AM89_9LECA
MTTVLVTQLCGGLAVYQLTSLDSYVNAIANYMAPGGGIEDPLAAIDASVGVAPENRTLTLFNIPFHRGPDPAPKSFAPLSNLPAVQSDARLRGISQVLHLTQVTLSSIFELIGAFSGVLE